jgi:hypothetical protein
MLKMSDRTPWGEEVLAQLVEGDQIPGFMKQAEVGPDEACVIVRDGGIVDVASQKVLKGLNQTITEWAHSWLGGGGSLQLLFVKTVPADLQLVIKGLLSKDYEEISGTCTMRVQFTITDAPKVISLMKHAEERSEARKGFFGVKQVPIGRVLLRNHLERLVEREALATVFSPQIAGINAAETRGNIEFIRDIETAAMVELKKTFSIWGLDLQKLYTVWDRTASDELMRYKKERLQAFEKGEFEKDAGVREKLGGMERDYNVKKKEQEHRWTLEFKGVEAEETMKDFIADRNLQRERKQADENLERFRTELERKKAELELEKEKAGIELGKKRAEAELEIEKDIVETENMGRSFNIIQDRKLIRTLLDEIRELEKDILNTPSEKAPLLQKQIDDKKAKINDVEARIEGGKIAPKAKTLKCPKCGEMIVME